MRRKKPELPEGDDGRTIVNMNVEGMPWHAPGACGHRPAGQEQKPREEITLTREESRYYTWGAIKAALVVVGVICAGIALFILFCTEVWFK